MLPANRRALVSLFGNDEIKIWSLGQPSEQPVAHCATTRTAPAGSWSMLSGQRSG